MHAKGFIHGALFPGDIIIDDTENRVVITNPGVSTGIRDYKAPGEEEMSGTSQYMAPEQFQGELSPAVDIYAFGIMLFEMFTGKPPFEGSAQEILQGHKLKHVPGILEFNPDAPPAMQRVINRAAAKKPEERYKNAGDILDALNRALKQEQEEWRVFYDSFNYDVFSLYRSYKRGDVYPRSFYRRKGGWNDRKKSKLIESILLVLPVPGIYLIEDEDGRKEVVDGQQRLSAIFDFSENKYALEELKILQELNDKKFEDLGKEYTMMQRRLGNYILSVVVIRKESDANSHLEIYRRLNECTAG